MADELASIKNDLKTIKQDLADLKRTVQQNEGSLRIINDNVKSGGTLVIEMKKRSQDVLEAITEVKEMIVNSPV